jgi:hypothetical protein
MMTASMNTKVWDDAELRKIDSEQMAHHAYEISDTLKAQYPSLQLFVAHWQGTRRLYRLSAGPGPSDETIKREWDTSPALRAEFSESFNAYTAFLRAERSGQCRILRK